MSQASNHGDHYEERWYLFDMESEHVDPRFQYWLAQHEIVTRVNAAGGYGMIASTKKELPKYFKDSLSEDSITEERKNELEPLSILVGEAEKMPNIAESLKQHNERHGKPERPIRNPLNENYGRPPNRENVLAYFAEILTTISSLMNRVEECDRLGLDSEFSTEIKEARDAIGFLRECIDNNLG